MADEAALKAQEKDKTISVLKAEIEERCKKKNLSFEDFDAETILSLAKALEGLGSKTLRTFI